jgi:hypothetical protein
MAKKDKFRSFISRILESSKLKIEAGSIQKAFQDEVLLNEDQLIEYVKNMGEMWESWKKLSSLDFISRFFEELGPPVFAFWLSEVFPFDFEQIRARCPTSPSSEDALLEISYSFDKEELAIIKDSLIAHWIKESEEKVAQTLFIEAVKSISEVFSAIINHPFKIFSSNVKLVKEGTNLKIHYSGAGRVVK